MAYQRSRTYISDYAQLQGINLLMNMIKQLRADLIALKGVYGDWQKDSTLSFENQVELIFGTSAGDKSPKFLVYCLDKLNREKMSEFPLREYIISLTIDSISAINRAVLEHNHIWNKAQLQTIMEALGSAHVIKGRSLPYYDDGEDEEANNGKKEKKKKPYVIEYKSD
ncbi:MAG: hypothetical protein ACFFDF_01070 [Candidatus Odinarchaeota archaeon]